MSRRWLLPVIFLAFAGVGAVACSESINPQPLPPDDDKNAGRNTGDDDEPTGAKGGSAGDDTDEATTGTPPVPMGAADSGDGGDAGATDAGATKKDGGK